MTENERIHELRKSLKLSMDKFGEKVGVGKTAISKIESGQNSVTEQMRKSICREFHVREEWLRDGDGEPFVQMTDREEIQRLADEVMADVPESFRRRFVLMLSRLTPDQWKTLSDIADMLGQVPAAPADRPAAASGEPDHAVSDQDLHDDLQRDIDLRKNQKEKSSGSGSMPA